MSRPSASDSDRLKVGDRLTSIDGRTIKTFDEFQAIMKACKPGEIIELGVVRNEQPVMLHVRLLSLSEVLASRNGGPAAR